MGVDIQCDPDIRMPHQVLQILHTHTGIRHIRTERVAEDMRRNMRKLDVRMQLSLLLHRIPHLILDVKRHL